MGRILCFTAVLLLLAVGIAGADVISVAIPECNPQFTTDSSGDHITAKDYTVWDEPGNPGIPVRSVYVLLPSNVDITSVQVDFIATRVDEMPGEYDLAPVPPHHWLTEGQSVEDWGDGKNIVAGRNTKVYQADDWYVAEHAVLSNIGQMRQYRLANIFYFPFIYNPVQKKLLAAVAGEIQVSYKLLSGTMAASVIPSTTQTTTDAFFNSQVEKMASNYDTAKDWYPNGRSGGRQVMSMPATADYVIITTSHIVNNSTKLQEFINHKTSRGFTVGVATEADWGGASNDTGDVRANKIHNWIKDNYESVGIRYVLLIGNPNPEINIQNPSATAVPMKKVYPWRSRSGLVPTDTYYVSVSGNWDLNGNGVYGEILGDSSLYNAGGFDLLPEIYVGRIPYYGRIDHLNHILDKTIKYESVQGIVNQSPGAGGDWVRKTLICIEPPFGPVDYIHGENVRTDAVNPSGFLPVLLLPEPGSYTSEADVLACWNPNPPETPPGFHYWFAHGVSTWALHIFTSKWCPSYYDPAGNPCNGLNDNYPCFTWQASCYTGQPDVAGNLAYSLLIQGAVSTVAASTVSYDGCGARGEEYVRKLMLDHLPCGDARHTIEAIQDNLDPMHGMMFNLYGDPSLSLQVGGPWITHNAPTYRDDTTQPIRIEANISHSTYGATVTGATVYWLVDGVNYDSAPMTNTDGDTWVGYVPTKPHGNSVFYYIEATDDYGLISRHPYRPIDQAPHEVQMRPDIDAPVIQPDVMPTDTAALPLNGYLVRVSVRDPDPGQQGSTGVDSVILHYSVNGSPEATAAMTNTVFSWYEGRIPAGNPGDVITYYITATDKAITSNSSRYPSNPAEYETINIIDKTAVLVLSNCYSLIQENYNADTNQRFWCKYAGNYSYQLNSDSLSGFDVLVLALPPDDESYPAISDWFVPGKTIVLLDGALQYGAETGFLWPDCVGTTGQDVVWYFDTYDPYIHVATAFDPITKGYLNQELETAYKYVLYGDQLGSDVTVLTHRPEDPSRPVCVYRHTPGHGRIVALPALGGLSTNQGIGMLLEASARQIEILSPAPNMGFNPGDPITINYRTSGPWRSIDQVRLEFSTGLDQEWYPIPGAEALASGTQSFIWNTSGSLPVSAQYKIRASLSHNLSAASAVSENFVISSYEIPGTPVNLGVTNITNTSATLNWQAGDPVGAPTVSYYWAVGTDSGVTYENQTDPTKRGIITNPATSVNVTDLAENTTYFFNVRAQTSSDGSSSAYASPIQFSTPRWAPWIATQLQCQPSTAYVGQNVTLTITAYGSYPLTYRLYKDWSLVGSMTVSYPLTSYPLGAADYSDAGSYRVYVSNAYGTEISVEATLTVLPRPWPETLYVDKDATGENNGSGWTNAYTELQEALIYAANSLGVVKEIRVAEGTYKPDYDPGTGMYTGNRSLSFQLTNGILYKGGYAGVGNPDPDLCDYIMHPTILSGDLLGNDGPDFANYDDNSNSVVTGQSISSSTVLEGFTIRGGSLGYTGGMGGGLYLYQSSPMVNNCLIAANKANRGGGAYCEGEGGIHFTGCTFSGNYSGNLGGGVEIIAYYGAYLTDCIFKGNQAVSSGGAIRSDNYFNLDLIGCKFLGNTSGAFGGAICSSEGLSFKNCLFSGNTAGSNGGAVSSSDGTSNITNCTFANNSASVNGGAIYRNGMASMQLANCIFWGNTAVNSGNQAYVYNGIPWRPVTVTVTYCDVQGGISGFYEYPTGMTVWSAGNIDADPLFVDAFNDDCQLSQGSPCTDAGNNSKISSYYPDLAGNYRFYDDPLVADTGIGTPPIVDMGAYEFLPFPVETPGIPQNLSVTEISYMSATLNWQPGDPAGSPVVSYYWAVGTDSGVTYENQTDPTKRGIIMHPGTSVNVPFLAENTSYCFTVKACTSADGSCSGYGTPTWFNMSQGCTPLIETQPQWQPDTVAVGQCATLNMVTHGDAPLTYEFYRGTTKIDEITSSIPINSYPISSTQLSDTGVYYVVIRNAHGSVTSDTAALTVLSSDTRPLYVSKVGYDLPSYDGRSWSKAKRTITAAMDLAQAGCSIYVAKGTYAERINMIEGVKLLGGYDETGQFSRDPANLETIIDGGNGGTTVTVPTASETAYTTIDGFTVKRGSGGGILCQGLATISNNKIIQNTASSGGAGIHIDLSYPGCAVISGNWIAENNGFGLAVASGSAKIDGNSILDNNGSAGGGILVQSTAAGVGIANNVIARNQVTEGTGGIHCLSGTSPVITNNTIVDNTGGDQGAGGLKCDSSCSAVIKNNIIAFNSNVPMYPGGMDASGSAVVKDYNNLYGNSLNYGSGTVPGENDISVDPMFYADYMDDYRLSLGSGCIDTGINTAWGIPATDKDGRTRILDGNSDIVAVVDIGAYEYRRFCVSTTGSDDNIGSNWDLAKQTVQAVFSSAVKGDEIWVAQGTYNASGLVLQDGMKLLGGFSGTGTERDWNLYPTTLQDSAQVVTISNNATKTTLLDGFTMTGNSYAGAGCTVYGSPIIRNNLFQGCVVTYAGGGIVVFSGSPLILNNVFTENTSNFVGGAIAVAGGKPSILNNTIRNNTAMHGGGIVIDSGTYPVIANNIIVLNNREGIVNNGGSVTLGYNNVWGNTLNYWNVSPGMGDISFDPEFTDLWHISGTSRCINAGGETVYPVPLMYLTDKDGQPRKCGSAVDIGADEYCQ